MYKYFHYIFGYYEIQLNGKKTELFLNELNKNNIAFWGYRKFTEENEEFSVFKISIFDAEKTLRLAGATHFKALISKKCGIPFIFEQLIKRPGLFAGFLAGFVLLYITSLFIWEVKIPEIEGIEKSEITAALEECGIKLGTFMPKMNVSATENLFLLKNPQFSYIL